MRKLTLATGCGGGPGPGYWFPRSGGWAAGEEWVSPGPGVEWKLGARDGVVMLPVRSRARARFKRTPAGVVWVGGVDQLVD